MASPAPPSGEGIPPVRGKASAPPVGRMAMMPPAKAGAPPPLPPRLAMVGGPLDGAMKLGSLIASEKHNNDLVNIHWKEPPVHACTPAYEEDAFLRPFGPGQKSSYSVTLGPVPSPLLKSPLYPSVFDKTSRVSDAPPPQEVVKKYFQRKQNKMFDAAAASSGNGAQTQENSDKLRTSLDKERMKLISLAIGGSLGSRSVNKREVFRLYREAIVECNYEIAKTDVLCPLLQLLENVTMEEFRAVVTSIVRDLEKPFTSELSILDQYEEADVFLFEMSKIPQVKTRIECMIFEQSFEDLYDMSVQSLDVIYAALEVLHALSFKLAKFFQFILQVGNTLNEGSRLGNQAAFSLGSLEKLSEVKSSYDPKVDLLHFVIALYDPSGENSIFSDSEIAKLKKAANLRSYRVRDEVKDLLDSVRAVEELPEIQSGQDDQFAKRMRKFSAGIAEKKNWLSHYAFNVFSSYKDLCDFFADPQAVYPPPKEKAADQFDIIELFTWFAGTLKQHEKDVKKFKLRARMDAAVPVMTMPRTDTTIADAISVKAPSPLFEEQAKPVIVAVTVPRPETTTATIAATKPPPVVEAAMTTIVKAERIESTPKVITKPVELTSTAAPPAPVKTTSGVVPAVVPVAAPPAAAVSPLKQPGFTPPGSPLHVEKTNTIDDKSSDTQSVPERPSLERRESSLSQSAALQSSIANLRAPTPPIAAIVITRVGESKRDLSASRPVLNNSLSQLTPPTLQFMVSPVEEAAKVPALTIPVEIPHTGAVDPTTYNSPNKKRLLITSRPPPGMTAGALARPSPMAMQQPPLPKPVSTPITFQTQSLPVSQPAAAAYPSRREGLPDPENFLDSRRSLSNTVDRVSQQLFFPNKDDQPLSPYRVSMGTAPRRPGTASILPPALFRPH